MATTAASVVVSLNQFASILPRDKQGFPLVWPTLYDITDGTATRSACLAFIAASYARTGKTVSPVTGMEINRLVADGMVSEADLNAFCEEQSVVIPKQEHWPFPRSETPVTYVQVTDQFSALRSDFDAGTVTTSTQCGSECKKTTICVPHWDDLALRRPHRLAVCLFWFKLMGTLTEKHLSDPAMQRFIKDSTNKDIGLPIDELFGSAEARAASLMLLMTA